jgi:hypothetical protein
VCVSLHLGAHLLSRPFNVSMPCWVVGMMGGGIETDYRMEVDTGPSMLADSPSPSLSSAHERTASTPARPTAPPAFPSSLPPPAARGAPTAPRARAVGLTMHRARSRKMRRQNVFFGKRRQNVPGPNSLVDWLQNRRSALEPRPGFPVCASFCPQLLSFFPQFLKSLISRSSNAA